MANSDTPAINLDKFWVKPDTLKDAAIEEVNEDSDLVLVVGDIDYKPIFHYKRSIKQAAKPKKGKRMMKVMKHSQYMYCDHCNFKTADRVNLILHIRTKHIMTDALHCSFCTFSTKKVYSLSKHIAQQHRTFKCPKCAYKTIYKQNYIQQKNNHKKMHLPQHGKSTFKICKKLLNIDKESESKKGTDSSKENKSDNVSGVGIGKSFLCSKCPFVTKNRGSFLSHTFSIHKDTVRKVKCDYCNFDFTTKHGLKVHMSKSFQESLIKCHKCDFESWYNCEYKVHKRSHLEEKISKKKNLIQAHEDTPNYGIVIIDGQEYPRKPDSNTLKYDNTKQFLINTKSLLDVKDVPIEVLPVGDGKGKKGKMFQCKQCTFVSTKKDSVKWHFQRQHTDSSVQPFLCLNCDFTTKTYETMRKHVKYSKSKELLYCKICQFTSMYMCQLKMHSKRHKPYHCKLCELTFDCKYKLKIHNKELHTLSQYKCDSCEFSTTRKDHMIDHQSKHTGAKPHRCSDCDFSCVYKSGLLLHIRQYHPKRQRVKIF